MMLDDGARLQRNDSVVANDVSETEAVMVDIQSGTYFGVAGVGKVIWSELVEPVTFGNLCQTLLDRFQVDPETCRRETSDFVLHLEFHGLVSIQRS